MSELRPVHASLRQQQRRYGIVRPHNMTRINIDADSLEAMQRIALSIFADMSNAGAGLHDAITAVYLSGINHGALCTKGDHND